MSMRVPEPPEPATPSRRHDIGDTRSRRTASEINEFTRAFSENYGLSLPIPQHGDSPVSRRSPLRSEEAKKGDEIVWLIAFLSRLKPRVLDEHLRAFELQAEELCAAYGWVYKPGADYDVLPRVSGRGHADFSARDRRNRLLDCLLVLLRGARQNDVVEPRSSRRREASCQTEPDVTPIPFNLGVQKQIGGQAQGKRRSDEFEDVVDLDPEFKKPRLPDDPALPEVNRHVDSMPVSSSHKSARPPAAPSVKAGVAAQFVPRKPSVDAPITGKNSANTSFASTVSAVFSEISFASTEATAQPSSVNVSFDSRKQTSMPVENVKAMGTDYGSSQYGTEPDEEDYALIYLPIRSQETDVDMPMVDLHPQEHSLENSLRQRLDTVFPTLPNALKRTPLYIRYEITRVFLHAGVSMDGLRIPDYHKLEDYDRLWSFLRNHPELQGKPMPEKSSKRAWIATHEGQANWNAGNFEGVIMGATLKINASKTGPFFHVRLQPLTTNLSHRLGRRFGNDRFLEMAIPDLTKIKFREGKDEDVELKQQEIMQWISNDVHRFLGIEWSAFYVKDIKSKKFNNIELKTSEVAGNASNKQIFLFAIDGIGFQSGKIPPSRDDEDPLHHMKLPVQDMLHWLIPLHLEKNQEQPYLKLFSRISLGLSKTYATVVFAPSEIEFKARDILSLNNEVMNDGCGQISRQVAHNIAQKLGLDYTPSAFQARICGAKGMWIVDVNDFGKRNYIKIYPSQVKWVGKATEFEADDTHRTFEVLRWTAPVRSAALNLQFLPILEDRGKDRLAMREAISRLLENGLKYEVERQRAAMDSPQSFRKWVRDIDPGIQERIDLKHVRYWAGLPKSRGEKLNLLLDAGFDPKKLEFMKEQAWKACSTKCQRLKERLNITVGRSAYLPMVVDFTGTLLPGEVHIGFSTAFKDESSNFCDTILSNMDVLVARSPAHYTSDIQRVRAVFKTELSALKDVVVFPTTGDFPLAGKLSGGDYDGDIAWVCWESSLVEPFRNADIPICPDMLKLGHITKDRTTYLELKTEHRADSMKVFLDQSFKFNMRQSLLGICTNFKEKFCYTKNDVRCYEAVFLSTLLSSLVDQSKQGYTFTEESWQKIKTEVIRDKVKEPMYKRDTLEGSAENLHLIDYLKFVVAKTTIKKTLTHFHKSLKTAEYWDEDVVKFAKWARQEAKTSDTWKMLLRQLDADIADIIAIWTRYNFGSKHGDDDESKAAFRKALDEVYPKWLEIKPAMDTEFTRLLTMPFLMEHPNDDNSNDHLELSTWALLRASVLFASHYQKNLPWWVAGKQLAHLKAMSKGIVPVIPTMYAMLKPDSTYVKLMEAEERDPKFWEARAESVIDEQEGADEPEGVDDE